MPNSQLLVSYRLGAVRVGLQATSFTIVLLIVFRLLPGHGAAPAVPYAVILVLAAAGMVGVRLLPWERMLRSELGLRALYAWSVLDILLITTLVGFTGGGRSEIFLVYGLTTVFFGAAYPPRSHVALLIFTFACYLAVLAATGWHVGAGVVVIRLGVLGILALVVSFLAVELLGHIESLQQERARAERWAGLLSTVAASAKRLTLDRDPALEGLVDSVLGLGFDGAALCLFDPEGESFVVTHPRGLPKPYVDGPHPAAGMDLPGLVREGQTAIIDERHPAADGRPVPLQEAGFGAMIASPVMVDDVLTAALLGVAHDRRTIPSPEVEAFELLSAQASLAMENAQRFEETIRMVERLEELDRLKDDFLATASHEIRTPLTVIMGSGLTLEQRWHDLNDSLRLDLLHSLNQNARALDELLSSLLDFARLGAESVHVETQPYRLPELLRSVAMRLSPLFTAHHLKTTVDPRLVVEVDGPLLERVVETLLSNAVKHTPPGTHVELSARAEGSCAVVAVADDGPGISEGDAAHLSERFYRGGDLNTRNSKGLGLGLALVREILQLHGSELEIDTRLGAGSRFAFRLPLASPMLSMFASAVPEPTAGSGDGI